MTTLKTALNERPATETPFTPTAEIAASNVQDAIEAIEAAAAADLAAHVAAADPHPVYMTAAEVAASYQPLDSDLTAIAALAPTNDDIIQRKAGAWTNRTMAQLATDLSATNTWQPLDSDLTSWAGVTRASGFDTFAATPSSANLASLVTGETGSGALVFGTAPAISDPDFTGLTDIRETAALTGDISPSQITSTQNDYNPTGLSTASVLRLSSDASRSITGLAGGSDGRIILIHNVGAQNIILEDDDAGSTAANRFALSADVTLAGDQSAFLQYDSTSSRWRLIGGTGGSSIATPVSVANGGTGQTTEAEAVGELIQACTEDTAPDNAADFFGVYDASADTGKKVKFSTVIREKLSAARTYYVRTDGSDSNTGLANTSGGAFLTIQKAIDVVAALDLSIYNVTIAVASGTYTGANVLSAPWVGSGTVTISGTSATVSTTSASCFVVINGCAVTLSGFTLQTTTSGNCIHAYSGGIVELGASMVFGACAGTAHMTSQGYSYITANVNYTISGSAARHMYSDGGTIYCGSSRTITLSGTPAFASGFAVCLSTGYVLTVSNTYSGAVGTGARYSATLNGVINTFGGGASYFPGSTAGSTATGGQYA